MKKANKTSAGVLIYKKSEEIEFLLVHPGGPYWAKKDEGIWSIPKGEFNIDDEMPLEAAQRELYEETGLKVIGDFIELSPAKMKSGKIVYAFAIEQNDVDLSIFKSNTFEIEWPPHSGKMQLFPEVDKAEWFNVIEADKKLIPAQLSFISELLEKIQP